AAAGLPVTDLAELTGYPAILGHRVVTLHPVIHGGLLADLHQPDHVAELDQYGIEPFALAVVNLYPFVSEPGIELIDIGGPTLIRAAAKNHAHVGVVMDPDQYDPVLAELRAGGALSAATRRALAAHAFAQIAAYDAEIATWFAQPDTTVAEPGSGDALPATLHLSLELAQPLRYGENPHQHGARYRRIGADSWWDHAVQHGGKELSYLNVYDTEAAWRMVQRFDQPAVVIVKHANPCGVAVDADISQAYVRANACDPVSAFGGIVAVNRQVTLASAEALAPVFTEVVVAPGYDDDALAVLTAKKNMRVLSAPAPTGAAFDVRSVDGGLLVQNADTVNLDRSTWKVVTEAQPTSEQWDDLAFAWVVCAG
ncbi:MAG TPA: bifunctional phosphoribosylaminoimidazolecarboxamide formyltransferase/IMP cyclohydrolase, partial [Ilumatobacteraceae bacterium]|nr:bifunctional phosphoribosylaminoimidazolecarboxamide formyltransferase/IMP cyclohydrolase [Ilumatobacteraceae bacterium]